MMMQNLKIRVLAMKPSTLFRWQECANALADRDALAEQLAQAQHVRAPPPHPHAKLAAGARAPGRHAEGRAKRYVDALCARAPACLSRLLMCATL